MQRNTGFMSRLDKESDEYENKLFKHKSISYVPMKAEIKNLFGYINVSSLKKFIQNLPSLKFLKFLKEEDLKHGILNDPDTKVIIFFFIFS